MMVSLLWLGFVALMALVLAGAVLVALVAVLMSIEELSDD